VVGNHELAINEPEQLDWFNPQARKALERTIELLSPESIAAIAAFPEWRVAEGVRLVHGFPPDSPLTYQFQVPVEERNEIMGALDERVCFIGHTHFPEILLWDGSDSRRLGFERGVFRLDADRAEYRYVINVGSVGQPRDGDNNAKYVVYCPEDATVELRYVAYDIESAVEKILAAGLPEANAWRLR
jgi:diadenosine tetraphosphatase ApaH/serine/threonine PP2A family protein phosphatase